MKKYHYAIVDSSTFEGETKEKVDQIESSLNELGAQGYRLVTQSGPCFILEQENQDDV